MKDPGKGHIKGSELMFFFSHVIADNIEWVGG